MYAHIYPFAYICAYAYAPTQVCTEYRGRVYRFLLRFFCNLINLSLIWIALLCRAKPDNINFTVFLKIMDRNYFSFLFSIFYFSFPYFHDLIFYWSYSFFHHWKCCLLNVGSYTSKDTKNIAYGNLLLPQGKSTMATTLHCRCVSGDCCKCTKYLESRKSDGLRKFCYHDISEHIIIAVVSADGNSVQMLESPTKVVSSSDLITSVPALAKKERMVQFSRAKFYSPNIIGRVTFFQRFLWWRSLIKFFVYFFSSLGSKGSVSLSATSCSSLTSSSVSFAPSKSSTKSSKIHAPSKKTTVTIICIDAKMKNQLPSSTVHVDMTKKNDSFRIDVAFAIMSGKEFLSFLKMNYALGESYAKEGYYMYSLINLYLHFHYIYCIPIYFHRLYHPLHEREACTQLHHLWKGLKQSCFYYYREDLSQRITTLLEIEW